MNIVCISWNEYSLGLGMNAMGTIALNHSSYLNPNNCLLHTSILVKLQLHQLWASFFFMPVSVWPSVCTQLVLLWIHYNANTTFYFPLHLSISFNTCGWVFERQKDKAIVCIHRKGKYHCKGWPPVWLIWIWPLSKFIANSTKPKKPNPKGCHTTMILPLMN